jgi:hypothetical protein
VDEIRLAVHADLAGKPKIEPSVPMTETVFPDGSRQWTLRDAQPVVDRQQWTLSIPLMQQQVAVPDIAVCDAQQQQRYLVLPRRVNNRPIYWDTQGLEKTLSTPEATTYKIVDKNFRAALLPSQRPAHVATVLLAEVDLSWDEHGVCRGTAHFDLDSAGRAWCPLLVPEGYRVVQVTVDGVPTTPVPRKTDKDQPAEGRRFRIPLGSPALPQRITVVFRGRLLEGGHRTYTFDTPLLGNLPVDKSVWLVVGPRGYELSSRMAAPRPLLDIIRADSFSQMVELAAKATVEASDKLRWSRTWENRLRCLQSDLKQQLSRSQWLPIGQPVEKRLSAIDRKWAALGKQLGGSALPGWHGNTQPCCDQTDQFRRSLLDRPDSTLHRLPGGGLRRLVLEYRGTSPSWASRHLPGVLILGFLFLLGYLAVAHGLWRRVAGRWPQGWILVVGLAWWLFLVPSILGLALVGVGIWLVVRRSRRGAESPAVSAE